MEPATTISNSVDANLVVCDSNWSLYIHLAIKQLAEHFDVCSYMYRCRRVRRNIVEYRSER